MESRIIVKVPESIDESTSFTDIMGGILLAYKKDNESRGYISFTHASLLPYATKFLKERTGVEI